jgi:hypothetical protein
MSIGLDNNFSWGLVWENPLKVKSNKTKEKIKNDIRLVLLCHIQQRKTVYKRKKLTWIMHKTPNPGITEVNPGD